VEWSNFVEFVGSKFKGLYRGVGLWFSGKRHKHMSISKWGSQPTTEKPPRHRSMYHPHLKETCVGYLSEPSTARGNCGEEPRFTLCSGIAAIYRCLEVSDENLGEAALDALDELRQIALLSEAENRIVSAAANNLFDL